MGHLLPTILFNKCQIKISWLFPLTFSNWQTCVLLWSCTKHKNLPLFCYNDQIYPKHDKLYIIIQQWNKNPNFKTLSLICDSPPSLFWFTTTSSWKQASHRERLLNDTSLRGRKKYKWSTTWTYPSHSKCSLQQGCVNPDYIFCEDEDSKVEESACFIRKLCIENTGIWHTHAHTHTHICRIHSMPKLCQKPQTKERWTSQMMVIFTAEKLYIHEQALPLYQYSSLQLVYHLFHW
jgi:hypothetical protein